MKKKFAYMIIGPHYEPPKHKAIFEDERIETYIFTVRDFEEAKERILLCVQEGFGVVELCGGFGAEKAKELIELSQNKIGISYAVHFTEQEHIFAKFFGK